jgi:A/G-specific adenine glycosylase
MDYKIVFLLEYGEMLSKQKIISFQKHILDWYSINKRVLPWRKLSFDTVLQSRDPYKILVSEVMAQQTQLSRVIPKYDAWVKRFPTVKSLAQAKTAEVLQYWNGLGYNRRALNLKKAVEIIVTKYNGEFPRNEKELSALPGIGKYTARAILCFAFNEQVAVVDTNVRKVIMTKVLTEARGMKQESRNNTKNLDACFLIHDSQREESITDKEIESLAQMLLPKGMAYEWNQALMDYAATVLKKEKILIPKQSTFVGSHRYYRGKVLKLLLKKKRVAIKDLGLLIKDDYTVQEKEWLHKLLLELQNEGFVVFKGDTILLSS